MPDIVRNSHDRNWHNINEQWVQGFRHSMNLCTHTNNRIESFFAEIKSCVTRRGALKEHISGLMKVICILRKERSHRLMKCFTAVSTAPILNEEKLFQAPLTPYTFQQVQLQLQASRKVQVIGPSEVQTSTGTIHMTSNTCECLFFQNMRLPCKHILALRKENGEYYFSEADIHDRWTIDYNSSQRFAYQNRPRVSAAMQPTNTSRALRARSTLRQLKF